MKIATDALRRAEIRGLTRQEQLILRRFLSFVIFEYYPYELPLLLKLARNNRIGMVLRRLIKQVNASTESAPKIAVQDHVDSLLTELSRKYMESRGLTE